MKLYYVYILECADKFFYTGITTNITRRFVEHQKGLNKTCFTFKRRPLELIFYQEFNDVNQAIFFEKKIKKWRRSKKLALGNEDFDTLQILSECNNQSHSKNYKVTKLSLPVESKSKEEENSKVLSLRAESRSQEVENKPSTKRGLDSARPDIQQSINQQIFLPILQEKKVDLYIKREDKIHPFVSGNKFRKLKYNILEAKKMQQDTLLTFGGAFSNHIVATAVAGKLAGLKTIGVIRGDELRNNLQKTLANNSTLKKAHENGMDFHFVSRASYRDKTSVSFINSLKEQFGDFYLIPEGGTNDLAIKGCEEILTKEDSEFDAICVAVGTGGTISGLINSAKSHQKVIGFPALKGDFLQQEIEKLTTRRENWSLLNEYHFGGYAKYNEVLISFINQFYAATKIKLDPIYTGKMLFGIVDVIKKDYFSENSKILIIHTGGLQGIEGVNQQLSKKNLELITLK